MKANILIDIGFITAANPKTKSILNKFDPITLPIAISVSPFFIATIDVTNSGREVPTATIVSPTKLALIPRDVAIDVAEFTTISPPSTIPAIPIRDTNIVLGRDISLLVCVSIAIAVSPVSKESSSVAFLADFIVLTKK